MKKLTKYSLIILSLILAILFFKYIIYPSHISVVASCNPEKFETDYPTYSIVGSFTSNYTEENQTKPVLTTYLKDEEDIPTKKHELCHLRQFNQHRLFSCVLPGLKLLDEIECYSIQRYYEIKEN